jgi:hypothetical protein
MKYEISLIVEVPGNQDNNLIRNGIKYTLEKALRDEGISLNSTYIDSISTTTIRAKAPRSKTISKPAPCNGGMDYQKGEPCLYKGIEATIVDNFQNGYLKIRVEPENAKNYIIKARYNEIEVPHQTTAFVQGTPLPEGTLIVYNKNIYKVLRVRTDGLLDIGTENDETIHVVSPEQIELIPNEENELIDAD